MRGEAADDLAPVREALGGAVGVSRETGERLATFVALIRKWQPAENLISPTTLGAIWTRHVADSAQLLALFPERTTVARPRHGSRLPGDGARHRGAGRDARGPGRKQPAQVRVPADGDPGNGRGGDGSRGQGGGNRRRLDGAGRSRGGPSARVADGAPDARPAADGAGHAGCVPQGAGISPGSRRCLSIVRLRSGRTQKPNRRRWRDSGRHQPPAYRRPKPGRTHHEPADIPPRDRARQPEGWRGQDNDGDQPRNGAGGDRRRRADHRPRPAGQRLDGPRHRPQEPRDLDLRPDAGRGDDRRSRGADRGAAGFGGALDARSPRGGAGNLGRRRPRLQAQDRAVRQRRRRIRVGRGTTPTS